MIGIVLGILKWIGILLLAILGLVLTLLLIVLLVPVRYRLQGVRRTQDGVLTARGKVSWFLSILAVTFVYDQEFSWNIRICGIPLKLGQTTQEEDVEDLTEEQLAQIAELEAEFEADLETDTEINLETDPQLRLQTQEIKRQTAGSSEPANHLETRERSEETSASVEEAEKVPLKEKLRGIEQKISDTIHSIPDKIAGLKKKIRSLKEKADIWIAFMKSDEVKQLLTACKKQIRQILRHLLPTSLKIRGNYGFADPSLTGKITGFLCALPPRYQKNIQVQPHFQEECLDGEVVLRGRIRLGSLVWPVIKILVKSCTWKVYKKFRVITKTQTAAENAKTSAKAKKGKGSNSTKKKSGKAGSSHKKKTKSKIDPHKGGKQ